LIILALNVIHHPLDVNAASLDEVTFMTKPFSIDSRTVDAELKFSDVPTTWNVEAQSEVELKGASPRDDGSFCLDVDYVAGQDKAEYRYKPEAKAFQPVSKGEGGENCATPLAEIPRLAIRVYTAVSQAVRESLDGSADFRIVMRWPPGTDENDSVWLGDLSWTLEGRKSDGWEVVARVSPGPDGTSAGSGWTSDPQMPELPALVMSGDASSEATKPAAPVAKLFDATGFAFSMARHGDPEGVYLGVKSPSPPVIDWNSGESWQRLFLEVVEGLGDHANGLYCVQAIYDRDGQRIGLFRNEVGGYTPGTEPPPDIDSCAPGETLAFPLVVQTDGALLQGDARFEIRQMDEAARFPLADARIALKAGVVTLAENSPSGSGARAAGDGNWYVSDDLSTLLLSTARLRDDGTQAPLTVYYSADGDVPQDALKIDGKAMQAGEEASFTQNLIATWDPSVTQVRQAMLCADRECNRPIAQLPHEQSELWLERGDLLAEDGATLRIDWEATTADPKTLEPGGPVAPGTQTASASISSDDSSSDGAPGRKPASEASKPGVTLELEPSIVFGSYRKPLTSCLAQLSSGDFKSESFSLRLGRQTHELATLPDTLDDDAPIDIVFNRYRGGGDCPVVGLRSKPTTLGRLRADATAGPVILELTTDEPLLAGYLQLNAAPYASSLVRWKNALEFFDRFHGNGRADGRWADGIVYGAGERSNIVPIVAPVDNFVASFSESVALRSAAQARRKATRVARLFFADQLDALAAELGDAPLELLIYDDLVTDCSRYAEDLAASPLDVRHAVVLAGIDGYTAQDGPSRSLSGDIAHVCVDSPALRVYAFNWRERAGNEDFELMLETILEDLDDNRFGARN